jgi:FKBP-type peptidyl-prolyl cis-trans isomerase 2
MAEGKEDSSTSAASDSSASTGTSTTSLTPKSGSIVTIDCKLKPEGDFIPEPLFDGIVLEDWGPPTRLAFVLGKGNYLPGLHDLISTMTVGQSVHNISLDAGWGSWNPNLQATVSFESLSSTSSGLDPSKIQVGVELRLSNGVTAMVTNVTGTDFTIDANPPMVGASYSANVKLITVQDGPPCSELEYSPQALQDSNYQVATFALGTFILLCCCCCCVVALGTCILLLLCTHATTI